MRRKYTSGETKTAYLKPGWRYAVRLDHSGTKPDLSTDYDYTLRQTGPLPSNVVITDDQSLFGVDDTSSSFAGAGKVAYVDVLSFSIVSDRVRSYDVCEDGQLLDSRSATIIVMPTNVCLDSRISFESSPEEVGTLVNDGCGTEIRFMLDGANVWKTSPIYWYGEFSRGSDNALSASNTTRRCGGDRNL